MTEENTSFTQSVAGVVIKDGKVLLARHTYGAGKGKLIVPGGYIRKGELPEEAIVREYLEEVGVDISPREVIAVRFNTKDWYVAFSADYIAGSAHSDNDENDEVMWLPIEEALARDDVPDLTKKLIECAANRGFSKIDYIGKNPPYTLYGAK